MSGQRLTPERRWWIENMCATKEVGELLAELDAVTRERDQNDDATRAVNDMRETAELEIKRLTRELAEAQLTLAEWRTDLGPIVAQHRNGDLTAADGSYVPAERDDETIPLGFHDGDAGGQP